MSQLQVLNKILQTKDASIITLNGLDENYFPDYREEFNFIANHLSKYQQLPDLYTVMDKFENNGFEVIEVNEPTEFLLQELNSDRIRREITAKYNQLRPLLMSGDSNAMEQVMKIVKEAADTQANFVTLNAVDLAHDMSRYETYEDMLKNHEKYFITTGFKELDDIIGGFNAKEDLVTIVARNGLGKSWILFKAASAAAQQGKTVGIYSGEMSADSVGFRIDTLIGGISNGAIMHGNASVKHEYKRLLEKINEETPGHIWIITPDMIGNQASISTLRGFIEKYNLDALYVDQHSLLLDERKGRTQVEISSHISADLKLLQSVKQIPIIAVSQQNREKIEDKDGKKQFDTTQVANADRIAQDSSLVIFIERDGDSLLKLHIGKSRHSGSGQVLTYKIDLNTGKFNYLPSTENTSSSQGAMAGYEEDEVF